ncbi:TetR/AcrR family transcriptional regulator [Nocardioides sp. BGMRC 2183]|nr:TetR/AcrR family transcriptional regulator [Nocardioides sp. BGMRC 2183]
MTSTAPESRTDGRQSRWDEHNRTRRRAIVDAAIAVLEQQSPGEELQLQAVADAAGMKRTVLYRHFEDRADLDRAVQRALCARLGDVLAPALTIDGRPDEIVHGLIAAFVRWAVEHPSLVWFAGRDLAGWGDSPINQAMQAIAGAIEVVMEQVVSSLGAELEHDDRAGLDPWVFGMINAVFAAVRRWMAREERVPEVDTFIGILSESIWLQVDGLAQSRGIDLPDLPIRDLLEPLGVEG